MPMKNRCRFCFRRQGHNRATCPVARALRSEIGSVATQIEKLRPYRRGDARDWPETRTLLQLLGAVRHDPTPKAV